jgi:PPOX class probable F420-dependent enzyme
VTPAERALVEAARRATLATIDDDGRPRLVPICFVLADGRIWSPLDEKPKSVDDVRSLARVRDIAERPDVTMLIDRWSEDWAELAWVRVAGRATLVEPAEVPEGVISDLRARYPQYADHDLEHRPMLRIAIDRVSSWCASSPA